MMYLESGFLIRHQKRLSLASILLFKGPPGCGKTSLANVFSSEISKAQNGKWRFTRLSACNAGVAQVKDEISKAKNERTFYKRSSILFIDEIHRFNKNQQGNNTVLNTIPSNAHDILI